MKKSEKLHERKLFGLLHFCFSSREEFFFLSEVKLNLVLDSLSNLIDLTLINEENG